ncbi:hypothetical protein BCR35DRAFT_303810 [Leucosporidium creatinivorum]|uniref:Uncharacterized protein n=1 Tax=Leucosporidium creatinivorum TaxID=106004 RepID=A0A1Y2FFL2_9BASI|nr:hypothetical protein BCR35DRAFT_303810 [Leucosporidium creatinivorum]
MDAQPAQQPTSTPYARPRQPEDSPAAALPTETLIRVLELAMEAEWSPFDRQRMRWRFQKVSWQWWKALGEQKEYAVRTEEETQALKQALSTTGRGGVVQSLALGMTLRDQHDDPSPAELVVLCTAIKELKVQIGALAPHD